MKIFQSENHELIFVHLLLFGQLLHEQRTQYRQLTLGHHLDQRPGAEGSD
jgi:hypothetical protein